MKVSIEPLGERMVTDLIRAVTGLTIADRQAGMLDYCQTLSGDIWTGTVDDQLVCCWGLIPPSLLSNQAYLWMWASESVREHQFLFVRHSQRVMERMLLRYETIVGHCLIKSPQSIRWLKWLGATFGEPNGEFIQFVIRGKHG